MGTVKDPRFSLHAPNGMAFIKCDYCEKEYFMWNRRTPPLCEKCMVKHSVDWAREYRSKDAKERRLYEESKK